jgi:hypothetical protein
MSAMNYGRKVASQSQVYRALSNVPFEFGRGCTRFRPSFHYPNPLHHTQPIGLREASGSGIVGIEKIPRSERDMQKIQVFPLPAPCQGFRSEELAIRAPQMMAC